MSRQYNMLHRVSYKQIIDVLKEAQEPLRYNELYELLPCEPDYINLEAKLHKMADKGMIKKRAEIVDNCEVYLWYVSYGDD